MCCVYIIRNNHEKFLPWGFTCVFTKREETFSGESFPEISGENVATVFPGKVFLQNFPRKYYDTNFANHAAVDTKVENIVGLGYDLKMTKATEGKLEERG